MKTLRESILNRSSHTGEGFKVQRRELIEKWLKKYEVQNYTINKDFTIYVNGDVNLFKRDLKEFPDYIQFGVVRANFHCGGNKLTSLEGAPEKVGGAFFCSDNQLTSLEGAPEDVGGDFGCDNNKLTSLKGAPKYVRGDFYCYNNKVQFTEKDVLNVCEVRELIFL